MEVRAFARHIRMTPRKVRLVADMIRGVKAQVAIDRLAVSKKWATEPVLKLLKSAMANATHNFKLDKDKLKVMTIYVDGGPTLKRFRPRAFGRAATIRKRTCHIGIVLSDVQEEVKTKSKIKATNKKEQVIS